MGAVFEATQDSPERAVALKIIRSDLSDVALARFMNESAALARLNHPAIAQIFEAGTEPCPFIAMEFVRGLTLDEYVRKSQPTLKERLDLILEIIEAVAYAHARGVIHLDLKPSNILVVGSKPKIIDFGIAQLLERSESGQESRVETGGWLGTLRYMSPEQAAGGNGAINHLSDVYTLGVIAYELVAHQLPYDFAGKAFLESTRVIREQAPRSFASRWLEPDAAIEAVLFKSLGKEQSSRYGSASEFADDFRRAARGQFTAARKTSVLTDAWLWAGREERIRQAGTVVGWICGILSAFHLYYALVALAMAAGVVAHTPELQPKYVGAELGFWAVFLGMMAFLSWKSIHRSRWANLGALLWSISIFAFMMSVLFNVVGYDVAGAMPDPQARELFFSLFALISLGAVLLFAFSVLAMNRLRLSLRS